MINRILREGPALAALLCTAALGACSLGPDYQRPTPAQIAPAHFPAAAVPEAAPPTNWWQGFGDPALNALVASARQHNADIAIAAANIRAARAGLDQAASARELQVDANARVGRDQFSKDSENFANIPFPNLRTAFTDYRAGFDVSWEIDLFGHTARTIEAAQAGVGVQQARQRDVALSVSAETARTVLDYRHGQRRFTNAVQVADWRRDILSLIRLQRAAGLASDIDLNQAERAQREAQALVAPLGAAVAASVAALVPLTGLPEGEIRAQLQQTDPPTVWPSARQFALSSTVLERRPDIALAERQLAEASAELGIAVADQYPRFALLGDAGWDSIQPGQFGQRASSYWNFGPQLTLPILSGGRIAAQMRQREAERDAALAGYRRVVLAALAEAESAMLRCGGDQARVDELDAAMARQTQTLALIERRVGAGEALRTELLDAQIQLGALVDQQLLARQALADDLVLLYKSLGSG